MKCPHCLEGIHENWTNARKVGQDVDGYWAVQVTDCPLCRRATIRLVQTVPPKDGHDVPGIRFHIVRPKTVSRTSLDARIPTAFADEYREAALVLADSPRASAALSRRCLQRLLHEGAHIEARNLNAEIDEAMKQLPSHLADAVDGVRVIGNFAAHPIKSDSTGELVDVEVGEAEWNLDTLEGLLDHYFVQPALLAEKREALNAKLRDAGRPELKAASVQSGEDGTSAA